jgi:hypothetical protein
MSLTVLPSVVVYGQPTRTPEVQQFLDDAQAYCDRISSEMYCVRVLHESPTTVVLGGDLLLDTFPGERPVDNLIIWQAVDGFKAQGYTIDTIQLPGQGTEINPHTIMIVMSK